MATDLMAWLGAGMERGLSLLANGAQFVRTTLMKDAPVWHMDGAVHLAVQVDTRALDILHGG